ncbi:MAG: hypothetical protein JWQ34_3165 [Mucilaginibacter sp.]|uniref:hypothetical protein n=1 Tax=Mucilaginibacter sp. TaxID=1882438 RepID=UPI0026386E73|nr:hypothetical protein [Mucilaginibacter sp.]MDB5004940.1 hypothetical protein [Mucilaginibacter sp.]
MKKTIFLFINICFVNISCKHQSSITPLEYKNISIVSHTLYMKDSLEIYKVLIKMLNKHIHPFKTKNQFDNKTSIYIDSIIYSPDKLRMAVLVITKNSTDKLIKKENNELYFYNANYLFCSRDDTRSPIKVYDYTEFNLVYYYNLNEIKERLHEYCFLDLANENKFNLDDIRLWYSSDFELIVKNSEGTQITDGVSK